MARIALLSEELINKIAAGEVVERPASVVKELCENALDASARTIRVTVEGGGLSSISVLDDGVGMSREDALMSLQRHATSKLRDLEGLFSIESMGFRGEAVPSIASVSRFSITTSEHGAAVGTRIDVEGGKAPDVGDAAPINGTLVEVRELFFNVPARRKYMKQEATELRHIQDAVIRLALGHPEVGFFLTHDSRELFSSPGGHADKRERVAAALGEEAHPHLMEISEERLGISITGFVASPEFTLPNARSLFTFVNRRYIRDRSLNFSIQRAFSPLLPPGRQPVGAVFIEMDPHVVDVNVHPQKMEVRFMDGREVTDAVHAAVARAVKASPWLAQNPNAMASSSANPHYAFAVHQFLARAQGLPGAEYGGGSAPFLLAGDGARAPAFGEARPDRNAAPSPGYFSSLRLLGELQRKLWVMEGPGGSLVALDAHAAFERVHATGFAQRIQQAREGKPGTTAPLFKKRVELPARLVQDVLSRQGALRLLGVEAEGFGGESLTVAVHPGPLSEAAWHPLFEELVACLPPGEEVPEDAKLEGAVAVLSCHAARQEERSHTNEEVRRLLEELDQADFACRCLHPKVVVLEAPLLDLIRR